MKELLFFELQSCPYCIRANNYLNELMQDPKYQSITIRKIDEAKNKALANQYDYYLVPTFYYQDEKLFEGIMRKEDVQLVLDKVLAK
jgi:glutaredoxin